MTRKSKNSSDAVVSSKSKAKLQFENLCKEIDYLKTKVDSCDSSELSRIGVLKTKVVSLEQKLDSSFSELSVSENEENFDISMEYKDLLVELSINLETKSKTESENNVNSNQNLMCSKAEKSQIKLPKLEIPHFYGENEAWISFKELFSSSILSNNSLSNIEKLQYLQTCVKGNAAKLIRGFSLQSENLKNCWEILCNRYENKRQLALAQINKIFMMKINKTDDPKSFLNLIDTCNESIRNLKTLGLESNSLSDLVFINFMVSKLDPVMRQRWELSLEKGDLIPDMELFRNFMEREAMGMGVPNLKNETKFFNSKKPDWVVQRKSSANHVTTTKENKCLACGQFHPLYKCLKFNNMPVKERWNLVKSKKLCANCLRDNHSVDACKININCKSCSERHHTVLHVYSNPAANHGVENARVSVVNSAQGSVSKSDQNVLLATALVKIRAKSGKLIKCKALIDNGSQNCLISRSCAYRLNLPLSSTNHRLVGINGITAETCLHSVSFMLSPYFNDEFQSIKALVVDRVTTPLPNFRLQRHEWPHTAQLLLADPEFYKPQQIDILIGADQCGTLLTGTPIHGDIGEPTAVPTVLGHVLMGPTITTQISAETVSCHAINLEAFFELEAVPAKLNNESNDAETLFKSTTKRTNNGRYIVKLPFQDEVSLGDSATHALRVFHSMERKLENNSPLKSQYDEFMDEYLSLNHMELLPFNELNKQPNYYLPHHAVVNNNSCTTKLRVVFNASAPSTNGKSLNSLLLKGPKLQTSIFFNLIKFRQYEVALTADIAKMYRQILVDEEDTQFQRIFWRKNKSDPLLIYKLKTVTYGEACAPFLALRTIQQLCEDEKNKFPVAAAVASNHFYIDDFLGGATSIESAKALMTELSNLFYSGGFELRKWSSNKESVIQSLPNSLKASSFTHKITSDDMVQRILGLEWNCKTDALHVLVFEQERVTTKRQLLSVIARIFDPLGLLAPSILILKLLLQEIWKANLDWDENLHVHMQEKWDKFNSEISSLKHLSVPRFLNISPAAKRELHGFCDASPQAYGAVVYLKVISDEVRISLVAAKTRVAPVTLVTLPKLELCGALLLAELIHAIKDSLDFLPDIILWSDSTIVLSWIKNPPRKGNQFVQHRISKIHALTANNSWYHIPGKLNIADVASRGLFPEQLKANREWWSGPTWLYEFRDNPACVFLFTSILDNSGLDEEKPCVTETKPTLTILEKISSFSRLIRIMAWITRFLSNIRATLQNRFQTTVKIKGPLTVSELNQACKTIVKILQNLFFPAEIKLLKANQPIPKHSKLISLNVFLDNDGILRVGGRLGKHPNLTYENKHPMLIPKGNNVTSAIIRYYHLSSLHSGPAMVLSLIRQKFWLIDGRSAVKKELRQCVRCARFAAKPTSQLMGELPSVRITPSRPFEYTGIDFAGPINTKCSHKRKYNIFKSYLCLFVCMSTKAVHLELVSELTTAAFLLSLRRFISRRGCPKELFTDNGKNFVGAASQLKKLFQLCKESSVQDCSTTHQITWHFMPPYGPNFGGLWESSIKLAKRHLYKTCLSTLFTFEELSTALCLIEACINSRPLTPLSTDPNDLAALTPGHFLIGAPLLALPEPSNDTNISSSLFSRWKLISAARSHFWKQWTRDYLNTLTARKRWTSKQPNLQAGQLVLLKTSSTPNQWTLARIISTHPGSDGLCRVVTLQTAHGIFKRPIQQIALLPDSLAPRGGYGQNSFTFMPTDGSTTKETL